MVTIHCDECSRYEAGLACFEVPAVGAWWPFRRYLGAGRCEAPRPCPGFSPKAAPSPCPGCAAAAERIQALEGALRGVREYIAEVDNRDSRDWERAMVALDAALSAADAALEVKP